MQIKGQEMREYVREYQRLIDKYKLEGIKVHTRKRIANDMGLSVPQADRYKHIFLLISEIQELIFTDVTGMSSVYPIASHSVAEQYEIYSILQGAIKEKYKMVRPLAINIPSSVYTPFPFFPLGMYSKSSCNSFTIAFGKLADRLLYSGNPSSVSHCSPR